MQPQQLAELRRKLPVFPAASDTVPGMAEFCAFYSLEFSTADFPLQHSVGTITSGPWRLATHLWQQPGARGNLLLVHGLFDHTGHSVIFLYVYDFSTNVGKKPLASVLY